MIGSGWVLGPLHAAQLAGAMSVWSWVLGAVMVLLLTSVAKLLFCMGLPLAVTLIRLDAGRPAIMPSPEKQEISRFSNNRRSV